MKTEKLSSKSTRIIKYFIACFDPAYFESIKLESTLLLEKKFLIFYDLEGNNIVKIDERKTSWIRSKITVKPEERR